MGFYFRSSLESPDFSAGPRTLVRHIKRHQILSQSHAFQAGKRCWTCQVYIGRPAALCVSVPARARGLYGSRGGHYADTQRTGASSRFFLSDCFPLFLATTTNAARSPRRRRSRASNQIPWPSSSARTDQHPLKRIEKPRVGNYLLLFLHSGIGLWVFLVQNLYAARLPLQSLLINSEQNCRQTGNVQKRWRC